MAQHMHSRHGSWQGMLRHWLALLLFFWAALALAKDDGITTLVTIPAGSYIIDMGVTPQTYANGLKPYGLVYELIRTHKVPVDWVILPGKARDGTDFNYTAKAYKGGPFIVRAQYASAAVVTAINNWRAQGVVVDGPIAASIANVPVYESLTAFGVTSLDATNGSIAANYFTNAGIPATAYLFRAPQNLDACIDMFAMPHADPTWATHNNLINFTKAGGYIWSACLAASVMENLDDPADADTNPDMNFLSNGGLLPYTNHSNGSPPYSYALDSDPLMQFMGILDSATQNGFEQIYLPKTAAWRASTGIYVWDPTHANVPGQSPGPAAVVAAGRAFGDSNNGRVVYEAGHSHDRTTVAVTARVAAMRLFLNTYLLSGIDRRPDLVPAVAPLIQGGANSTYSVSVSGGGGFNTYAWSDSCGGTFSTPTQASTTYTAPTVKLDSTCIIRVSVTDGCDRLNFAAVTTTVNGKPDLALTKTDSQDPVPVNGNFSYVLNVSNSGDAATGITLTDTLPAGLTYLGFSGTGWNCSLAGSTVTCTLASLATGANSAVTLNVRAPGSATTLTNTASVTAAEGDFNPADNSASQQTLVRQATDLEMVSKTASPTSLGIGQRVSFTLKVRNNGPLAATNVEVTDPLPTGLNYVSAAGSGWSCGYAAASRIVTCSMASLASGATAADIVILADAASSGSLNNTASVASADLADSNAGNNSKSAAVTVQASADLRLYKTTDTTSAADNAPVNFTLSVANLGPDTATGVYVTDVLTYAANFSGATGFRDFYDNTKYGVQLCNPACGAWVYGGTTSRTISTGGKSVTISFNPATSGALGSATPNPVPANGTPVTVRWDVSPSLAPGETLNLKFLGYKEGNGSYTNTATVYSGVTDLVSGNNSDFVTLKGGLLDTDLALSKSSIPASVNAGTTITYRLRLVNNGPSDLGSLDLAGTVPQTPTIVDTLPAGTTLSRIIIYDRDSTTVIARDCTYNPGTGVLSCSTPGNPDWSCAYTAASHTVTCAWSRTDSTYRLNENYYIDVIVTAPQTGGTLTNTATESYDSTLNVDNNHANDTATATTTVIPRSVDLALTKTVSNATPTYQTNVTFTVTVSNTNASYPNAASNVSIVDALPAGLTYVSHTASTGSYANGTWLIPTLAYGASATLTLVAKVDTLAAVTNTAQLAGLDQADQSAANNSASATVNAPDADLSLTKTVDKPAPNYGDTVTFTVSLRNNGPEASTGSVVLDQMVAGLDIQNPVTDITASSGTPTYDPATRKINWSVANLAAGATVTLTIKAKVTLGTALSNTASITSAGTFDADTANNTATVNLDVQAADLSVDKSAVVVDLTPAGRPDEPDPGDHLVYTVTVTNKGPKAASNVKVTDLLPSNGISYVSHAASQGSYTVGTGIWDIGSLTSGQVVTLTVTMNVVDFGLFFNTASITSASPPDPDTTNNTTTHRIEAKPGVIVVSGRVYLDANTDGTYSSAEQGLSPTSAPVSIANLCVKLYQGGTVLAVTTPDASGLYAFNSVANGPYLLLVDTNNCSAGSSDATPTLPTGWVVTESVGGVRTIEATGAHQLNLNFGLYLGTGGTLSGKVFKDNGSGGATANDGVANGGEIGLPGIKVRLTDCSGLVRASTTTDGGGAYRFVLPQISTPTTVCVEETNPSGYTSTGASIAATALPNGVTTSVGGVSYTYSRPGDTISLTIQPDTSYANLNFGDVPLPALLTDGEQAALPGAVTLYPHVFRSGSAGTVSFRIAQARATPAIPGWQQIIYRDANCNGQLDAGENSVLWATGGASSPVAVAADATVCLLVKEFVPGGAPDNAQDLLSVEARFAYANAAGLADEVLTRSDLTTVGIKASGLVLRKSVDKGSALPGEQVTYAITYRNDSTETLRDLVVRDATPAFTSFVGAICVPPLPANLTSCSVSQQPALGGTGAIVWTFVGTLAPSGSGSVSFAVRVDQ